MDGLVGAGKTGNGGEAQRGEGGLGGIHDGICKRLNLINYNAGK